MTKYKTTDRKQRENNAAVIGINYCEIQNIERFLKPAAYNCGQFGWRYDLYETDYNVAISTGYDYLEFAFNKVWKERSKIIKKKLLELDKKIQEHKIKIPTIWLDAHHKIYKMVNEIIRKACEAVEDDYE